MAPLPESNTPRYRVHYTVGTFEHTMQFRSAISPVALGALVEAFTNAFGINVWASVITNVEFAPSGSNIFNLVLTGAEGHSYGVGAMPITFAPLAYNFIGRSNDGRRVRLAVFGSKSNATNFRVAPLEESWIDDARGVLVGAGSSLLTIGGLAPVWKTYVNVKNFDHWVDEIRQ